MKKHCYSLQKCLLKIFFLFFLYGISSDLKAQCNGSLGLSFTSNRPQGCDSTTVTLRNNSTIPLSRVSKFVWDFGDGMQDSTNWGNIVTHKYYAHGRFDVCLTVTDTSGCTDTFCVNGAATNHVLNVWIESEDSLCYKQPFTFELKPSMPEGITSFFWIFGDPNSAPYNIDNQNPITASHTFSKPSPFLVKYIFIHNVCGTREIFKQVSVLGVASVIPGTHIPLNQRYQCRALDTVYFPNESVFFHSDKNFADDASGYFDTQQNKWIYYFDSSTQILRSENLQNRGNTNVFRIWDFDDEYAPQCTTNTAMGINVGINCRYSLDSLPKHGYTDWEDIYRDSFYLPNRTLHKTVVVKDDTLIPDGCSQHSVDTNELAEHRRLFYEQIPRIYRVRLWQKDTSHASQCESEAITPIAIMRPNAQGLHKQGRYCFGIPPNYGVTFELENTKPGFTCREAYLNPDTALNPNNWIAYFPGGAAGTLPSPSPIMPYPMSGPYPGQLFMAYPNPTSIKDTLTGYANVGLIIGNGTGNNRCYDTAYYEKFIKFPIIDSKVEIVTLPPIHGYSNVYRVCKGDSLVMRIPAQNKTIPWDADQLTYSLSRFAPSDAVANGKFPFYSYTITETYEWFVPRNGGEYLENFLNRTIVRTRGNNTETLFSERFSVGRVDEWETEADISQVYDALKPAFEQLGFSMGALSPKDIADVISIGCIDTAGFGEFIRYIVTPITCTSTHFRDTSIFPLTAYGNPTDYTQNVYTLPVEENGIFNLVFQIRAKEGCITQRGHRVIVGSYNTLTVSDSVLFKGKEITATPYFRYFHIDPENNNPSPCSNFPWLDCNNHWQNRASEAGQPNREGITQWDWSMEDDDPALSQTVFGADPYGATGYESKIIGSSLYYQSNGTYTLRLAVSDSLGCTDTLYQKIYATEAKADFSVAITPNECENRVIFNDLSYVLDPCNTLSGYNCDSITQWTLDWGDGSNPLVFTQSDPISPNLSHIYTAGGIFNIRLTVKSALGATDTLIKQIEIDFPKPSFTVSETSICMNNEIVFTNTTSDPKPSYFWVWDFGDGTTQKIRYADRDKPVSHTYTIGGSFSAFLTVVDSASGQYCEAVYPNSPTGVLISVSPAVSVQTYLSASKDTVAIEESVLLNATAPFAFDSTRWIFTMLGDSDTLVESSSYIYISIIKYGEMVVESYPLPVSPLIRCVSKGRVSIFVDSNRVNSVRDIRSINFVISPNPVRGFCQIEGETSNIYSIKLFDTYGRFIRGIKTEEAKHINVSNLSSGIYFMEITTQDGTTFTHKMLKE